MEKLRVFNAINVLHVANNLKEEIEETLQKFGKNIQKANKPIFSLQKNIIVLPKQFKEY